MHPDALIASQACLPACLAGLPRSSACLPACLAHLPALACLRAGLPGAPIIFGCETKETGEIYKQRADGLFGLGNSDASGGWMGA